jgi:predicted GIY-YIG superfamily endonuclease
MASQVRVLPPPPSCFALTRFAGFAAFQCAKQDALRSLGEGGRHLHYVYLLESETFGGPRYIGLTTDLKKRLADHNAGKSRHTSKYMPWKLVTYVAFSDIEKARAFERYLKSGSGHAFAKKRLW